jgi:hypothetical protein
MYITGSFPVSLGLARRGLAALASARAYSFPALAGWSSRMPMMSMMVTTIGGEELADVADTSPTYP